MTSKTERPAQGQRRALSGTARRANSAPPYYLGHYAGLWITVMAHSVRPAQPGRRDG